MFNKIIRKVNFDALLDDLRKIGVNFITAGIIGIFVNHFTVKQGHLMVIASTWITITGVISLAIGIYKR